MPQSGDRIAWARQSMTAISHFAAETKLVGRGRTTSGLCARRATFRATRYSHVTYSLFSKLPVCSLAPHVQHIQHIEQPIWLNSGHPLGARQPRALQTDGQPGDGPAELDH